MSTKAKPTCTAPSDDYSPHFGYSWLVAIPVAAIAFWIGSSYGARDVRDNTMIMHEKDYVSGPYFGSCTYVGPEQVCAGDKREEKVKREIDPPAEIGCIPGGGIYARNVTFTSNLMDAIIAACKTQPSQVPPTGR